MEVLNSPVQFRQFRENEEGFSLIELVVVVSVLSILSAVAIPTFNCFQRKAQATAALAAIKQIQSECAINKSDTGNAGTFTSSNLNSYQIQSNGSTNSCDGASGTGLISAIPNETDKLPTFLLANNTNELTYSFKGQTGANFTDCLGMLCNIFRGQQTRDFVLSNQFEDIVVQETYIERGCSAYTWVKGPSWLEAQANAKSLGGNLTTINDKEENDFLMNIFNQEGRKHISPQQGHLNLHIGLTKTAEADEGAPYGNGWISGESSLYRPSSWGVCNSEMCGMGTDPDGDFTSFILDLNDQNPSANWNDFPNWQGKGLGLAEINICN